VKLIDASGGPEDVTARLLEQADAKAL